MVNDLAKIGRNIETDSACVLCQDHIMYFA